MERLWRSLDGELMIESQLLGKQIQFLDTEELRTEAYQQITEPEKTCLTSDLINTPGTKQYFDEMAKELHAAIEKYRKGEEADNMPDDDPSVVYRNQAWIKKLAPYCAHTKVLSL